MATVERPAGVNGTFEYLMPVVPAEAPKLKIYTDVARTIQAPGTSEQTGVATGNPSIFRFSYPSTLPAATYYLGFTIVYTTGQPSVADNNDSLVLFTVDPSVVGLLVSLSRYRTITVDTASPDASVTAAIEDATQVVEEYLRRPLRLAERTETIPIDQHGRVFPTVTPIISVTTSGLTIHGSARWLEGATPDDPGVFAFGQSDVSPVATIIYSAGFTQASLPETIERRIAWLARAFLLEPSSTGSFPPGAKSVSVGDASVTFDRPTGRGAELTAEDRRTLRPWRRR